ncbi:LysR family transcriptional regulator [Pseudonocardia sp. GCM10023141]|uniref:LysR family transcriptional regulator n=1 Tax=Pseudonocardia sp. GCM10023141 TaxID=3252653 RepID=UPI0036093B0F
MLLRQLEYLCALAREQHFGRAAKLSHVSQPALSEGIRRLESELGVQIVRRGRSFEGFTPEGERAVAWAQRIVADSDALRGDLSSMRAGMSGVLRIGAIPTALAAVSLLTAPFCDRHPLVRVSLESLSSREIVHRLAEFDLDIGITYIDGEPLGAVRTVTLYRERYLLLTSVDGPFADHTSVGWAELASTPMCLLAPVMQNRRIIDRYCAEAGVTVVPSVEADTVSVLYGHVATRRWSTVIAHAWLHLFGVPAGMRVIPMDPPRRPHRIGLVLTEREPEPMLAHALLDVARHVNVRKELDALLAAHLGEA